MESGKDCVEFDAETAVIPRAVDTQPILVVFDAHYPLSGARDGTRATGYLRMPRVRYGA